MVIPLEPAVAARRTTGSIPGSPRTTRAARPPQPSGRSHPTFPRYRTSSGHPTRMACSIQPTTPPVAVIHTGFPDPTCQSCLRRSRKRLSVDDRQQNPTPELGAVVVAAPQHGLSLVGLAPSWLSGGKNENGANRKGRWRSNAQASLVELKNLRIHAHSPLIERTVPGIIKDEANQSASIRPGSIKEFSVLVLNFAEIKMAAAKRSACPGVCYF